MSPDVPPRPLSPNSVLANALLRSVDMIRPKVHAVRPARIVFVVGTQINGAPHLGTSIVQTSAFLLAKAARRAFSIDTAVRFSALDNAPYEITLDPETHHAYQITYHNALGKDGVEELVDRYYRGLFASLADATGTEYELDTYTTQQASSGYRAEFLRSLEAFEAIRWWLAPSTGVVHIRLPCPRCGWAEKRAESTRLVRVDEAGAVFTAMCFNPAASWATVNRSRTSPWSPTTQTTWSSLAQSTPAVTGTRVRAGAILTAVSSLLHQWEDTRWSRDTTAGRSLSGAQRRIAL
jgi:hypothetical protein